jgi:DNA-binding protein HU-beta
MATKPNKNIKVSQKTIDDIKKMGMTKALKEIKNLANQGQGTGAAGRTMRQEGMKLATSSEFAEGVRRLYGDRRSAAARTQVSTTTSRGPAAAKMAKKVAAPAKKAATSYSPSPMKTPAKKSGGVSNTAKVVAGTTAAVALLALTRGKGAGVITSRLAPGLMKNKVAQALITGEIKKAAPKVVSKAATKTSTAVMKAKDAAAVARGKAAAKAGKPVSQSQYDAMVAAAKAKGVSTVAKKATTTAAKKTVAKKVAKKAATPAKGKVKTAAQQLVARGQTRWDANAPK